MPIALLVHGGAGAIAPDDRPEDCVEGCLRAVQAGHAILARGGSALDAVEAAVFALEENPLFNAGYGACLTADGEVELDASIMDGKSLAAGGVAAVRGFRNPVRLARAVMERTSHVLFAGEGALRFADEVGLPRCEPASLVTSRAQERLRREQAHLWASKQGTVGAVALDQQGHVAAATSTGGTSGKRAGRVGDSPIIGAGTYADDCGGAVSATGQGEAILRVSLSKHASDRLRAGASPQEAAESALAELERVRGAGGLILVDRQGRLAFAFNTARMARAWVTTEGQVGAAFAA